VEQFLRETEAEVIFLPHTADTHPTHRAVLYVTLLAVQRILSFSSLPTDKIQLYMYEGPWALFPPACYNTVSSPPPECFSLKMDAIRCHKSQTGRTRYDRAADSLAILRASLVPEQDLAGFGQDPPKLEERVELFWHRDVSSASDVQELIWMFEKKEYPKR
jgi:LmbE family N-acetylglucosaminyl deacetylase